MLYSLFLSGVFAMNAMAILHEQRFLAVYNLIHFDSAERGNLRAFAASTFFFARYFRFFLIFINILAICFENVYAGVMVSAVFYNVIKNNYTMIRMVHDGIAAFGSLFKLS